jgi:hypothetical protein
MRYLLVVLSLVVNLSVSGQIILKGATLRGATIGTTNATSGGGGGCTPTYPASGSLFSVVTVTQSGALAGPQSGNPNHLFDGNFNQNDWLNGGASAGAYIQIQFTDNPRLITEWKFTFSAAPTGGVISLWKWQACNDGVSFADIGSSFQLTGTGIAGAIVTDTSLIANTTQYSYYKLVLVSGNPDSGPWFEQMNPKACH